MLAELTLTFVAFFLAGTTEGLIGIVVNFNHDILMSIIAPFWYGLVAATTLFIYMYIPTFIFLIMTVLFYCRKTNLYIKWFIGLETIIFVLLPSILNLLHGNNEENINIDTTSIIIYFMIAIGQYYKYIFIKKMLIKANHYGAVLPSKMTETPSF